MKATINPTTTAERLGELTATASRAGATHAKVMKAGGKRAGILPLAELDATYRGVDAEIVFGTKHEGLPFEPLPAAGQAPVETVTEQAEEPKTPPPAPKVAPKKAVKTPPEASAPTPSPKAAPKARVATPNTGFMAIIDDHLLDIDKEVGVVEGFERSKYSVNDVVAVVMAKLPDKNPDSVRKIIKVRPRHLEKQKKDGAYDGEKNRAPRWRWTGPGIQYASPDVLVTTLVKDGKKDAAVLHRLKAAYPTFKDPEGLVSRARALHTKTKELELPPEVSQTRRDAKAKVRAERAAKVAE